MQAVNWFLYSYITPIFWVRILYFEKPPIFPIFFYILNNTCIPIFFSKFVTNKWQLTGAYELFEGPVGDYCIARNTIKCLFKLETPVVLAKIFLLYFGKDLVDSLPMASKSMSCWGIVLHWLLWLHKLCFYFKKKQ